MKIGLALPHYDFSFPDGAPATIARVLSYAERAEALGFESVWVSDHLFLDLARYGGPPDRAATPSATTLLAAIAARTERVRLGPLVLCVPFRNPRVLAQEVRSLHDLSGGRLELGLGAGWYEPEFAEASIPFESVGARIRHLERVTAMLHEHLGKDVPIFVGGKGGPKILRIVARAADGWNVVWRIEPDALAERIVALRAACADAGRDPAEVNVSVGLYTLIGTDARDLAERYRALQAWTPGGALDGTSLEAFAAGALVGTAEQCRAQVDRLEAMGVGRVILSPASLPFSVFDDEQVDLAARALW